MGTGGGARRAVVDSALGTLVCLALFMMTGCVSYLLSTNFPFAGLRLFLGIQALRTPYLCFLSDF